MSKFDREELEAIGERTISHYESSADAFWRGTRDHDVNQNISALLRHLPTAKALTICDLGCGPGRDLVAFRELGHEAIGVDGTPAFVRMAREHSGCEVWQQEFLSLQLPDDKFDGIYANASLFHVPGQELPRVLAELAKSLKKNGVLFASNPHGQNQEGWSGNRYACYWDWNTWKQFTNDAGFVELEHFYRPTGKPRQQQPWLASVWRKLG